MLLTRSLRNYRKIGEWPNTYTFSKALAEDMIQKNKKLLPVAIFRPSMGEEILFSIPAIKNCPYHVEIIRYLRNRNCNTSELSTAVTDTKLLCWQVTRFQKKTCCLQIHGHDIW
jgi:hypothetical protein